MNNQQIIDPSLTSIQNELIGEDLNKGNKSSMKESTILIIICLAMCIAFFIVYALWMSIPVKKHDILVEYLFSSQHDAKVGTHVHLSDNKNIGIDLDFFKDQDFYRYQETINKHAVYQSTYNFSEYKEYPVARPLERDTSASLSRIIGHKLYKELSDYCRIHDLKLSDYTNLFYSRHLDNEKGYATMKHNIVHTNASITIIGINDFVFSNYLRLPNRLFSIIWKLFQMEDVTQSYYSIALNSSTIKEASLRMSFFGTINCIPFEQDQRYINIEPLNIEKDTSFPYFKTGRFGISKESINLSGNRSFHSGSNSFRIWSEYGAPMYLKCLVKFNDMENTQTMRLFILAALITMALTTMIKSFWKIRKIVWKRLIVKFKALWKKIIVGTLKLKIHTMHSRKKRTI